jgi:ferredoxin
VAEELFTDICNRCMACAEICPQGILIQGAGGYPEADFMERGCTTFCGLLRTGPQQVWRAFRRVPHLPLRICVAQMD